MILICKDDYGVPSIEWLDKISPVERNERTYPPHEGGAYVLAKGEKYNVPDKGKLPDWFETAKKQIRSAEKLRD